MGKFFQNKTCIYLDQFAVSNLAEKEDWREIFDIIKTGVDNEKLLVLYSTEHLIESSQKDYDRALVVDNVLFAMSQGFSMGTEAKITARLLVNAIRQIPIRYSTYCTRYSTTVFEDRVKYDKMRKIKETYNQMVKEGTSFLNQIRVATRPRGLSSMQNYGTYAAVKELEYQKGMEERLKKFSRYGFCVKQPIVFSMITIPHWGDVIMDILIKDYQLSYKEAKKGEDVLKRFGLRKILPTLYVRSVLETMLALKHQQETVNDHVDVIRLSCAIPFADVVLTDKSKVYDIRASKLDSEFQTEVFSGTPSDLANFKSKLMHLIKD